MMMMMNMIMANGLSMNYYLMACPFADMIIKNSVNRALQSDPTLAAGLVRMHFHDCFVEVNSNSSYIHIVSLCFLCLSLFIKCRDVMVLY